MKIAILLSVLASVALSSPVQQEDVLKNVVGNFVNCMNSDLSLCLKEHALRATERLGAVRSLKLSDSFTFINNGDGKQARSLEPLSSELEERKQQVTQRLWQSTTDLLQNSEIEFSYGPEEEDDSSRALGDVSEARGKKKQIKKKLKMLLPLAILAKVKAGALAILFLGIIAISLFKIAAIVKLAFLAKLFSILKSLLAKKHESDHGWAAPHHEEHHSHGWDSGASASQGWSRSQRNDAQSLAYAAYRK